MKPIYTRKRLNIKNKILVIWATCFWVATSEHPEAALPPLWKTNSCEEVDTVGQALPFSLCFPLIPHSTCS